MLPFCGHVAITRESDIRRREHTGISDFGQIMPGAWNCLQNRAASLQFAE
jgi:hypothetical protein